MKYGVNTMVWTTRLGKDHEPLFEKIREWGFDGVEPFVSTEEPADIPALRQILDRVGLERTTCVVLPRHAHLISADRSVRMAGVQFLRKCVERTAGLGGSVMAGPIYAGLGVMSGARRTDDEWKYAVEGLRATGCYAETLGVTLCPEPLNRFETYFLNTLSDGARLVEEIGLRNVKLHFDTFHANIEERHPAESLAAVASRLGHVHFSENDRGIPGTGHCDWRGVMRVLKQMNYQGWITIESFARPEPDLAAAAAIWRDPAPSGDVLAQQGIDFIKRLAAEA
jgi:D-psicose/D-tagatose/L-ribulose 3-epimerase